MAAILAAMIFFHVFPTFIIFSIATRAHRKYDIRSANNNNNNKFKYQDFILVEFIRIGSLLFGNLL